MDVLRSFAVLGEIGRGLAPGHGDRACLVALAIADRLGVDDEERAAVMATSLLFHAGCTAGSSHFAALIAADELAAQRDMCLCDPGNLAELLGWVRRNVAAGAPLPARLGRVLQFVAQAESAMGEFDRGCSEVGALVAARLGLPHRVQQSLRNVCETWNGKGAFKVSGEAIPLPARIAQAGMLAEVYATDGGPDRALGAIGRRAGRSVDPAVAKAFADVAGPASFWEGLQSEAARQVLANGQSVEPAEGLVDATVRALADVVDLKSPAIASHSRTAGTLVADVAREMGLPTDEAALATRAAWVHDVGKVGVPCALLEKRGVRTPLDEERLLLHIAFSERIVGSAEALADLLPVVAAHHERMDGSGPRGDRDSRPAVRLIAAVDAFLEDRDARIGPPSERSADAMRAVRATPVDPTCLDALQAVLARSGGRRAPKGPADLSEREQEVLALVARGLTNKEIAAELHVSPHTVRHHLESVYAKIDVISRAGATLFAAEHGYA